MVSEGTWKPLLNGTYKLLSGKPTRASAESPPLAYHHQCGMSLPPYPNRFYVGTNHFRKEKLNEAIVVMNRTLQVPISPASICGGGPGLR